MQDQTGMLQECLTQYLTIAPHLLALAAGIGIALARWRRHPRTSGFALLGLGLMLLTIVAMIPVYVWAPRMLQARGTSALSLSAFFRILAFARSLVDAGAWVCILAAIFGGRPEKPAEASPYTPGSPR